MRPGVAGVEEKRREFGGDGLGRKIMDERLVVVQNAKRLFQ